MPALPASPVRSRRWCLDRRSLLLALLLFGLLVLLATLGRHWGWIRSFGGDLLAVVDTLERGLEMSDPNDEAIKPMREGMELTLKMFDDTLRRYQVEALNPEGEPFNPEQHQAMAMQESASAEPGSVLKVFPKGLKFDATTPSG